PRDAAASGRPLRRQQDLGRGDRAPLLRCVWPVGALRPHRPRADRRPSDDAARVLGLLQPARRRAPARALHHSTGHAHLRRLLRRLRQPLGLSRPRARPRRPRLRAARSGGGLSPMIRDVVSVRDKTRIHYRRLGQGPGMVLLHGYPQTGHMWRKVTPAFAERFTVVARDLRGYGDSDRPVRGYDKRTMAADIADLIQALSIQPVVLIGHDPAPRPPPPFPPAHPALLTRPL